MIYIGCVAFFEVGGPKLYFASRYEHRKFHDAVVVADGEN